MSGRDVHLVGSVPMADAAQVFATVSAALGTRLKRIPDGETGERSDWITWLEPVFAGNPALEKSDELFRVHDGAQARLRYRLKGGLTPDDVHFDNLFYADIARESYATFKHLRNAGTIPQGTRFQVDLVPAHSVIWLFLADALHAPIDPIYNAAVKREIDKIVAAIPHADLAIQFDVASAVFARLQRNQASGYGRSKEEMQATFSDIMADLGNQVPADVELLFHLCYGDANHRHVVEPTDMGDMVDFINLVSRKIDRAIDLVHMPVPRDRCDGAYFAPLQRLQLGPETELCLGLVHYTDGVAGSKQRLATARRYVADFSIATECGFGRRDPRTIPELLRIHAEVAELD
jgi:methionine synthase II (cobalamin-independent)